MARFKFGRPISLRWNGLLIEGPAETVFEIPDEYYEEFEEDIHPVEPTLVWLDSDEGATLRGRVTALETSSGSAVTLSNGTPLALGTAAPGTGTSASRYDHVHPTTGLALSGHNHSGVYDPAGTAASAVSAHEAASDPHPVYLTDAEGDAQYADIAHTHTGLAASYTSVIKQYVKNDSTAKSKGEAVYISSADGTNPIVSYADADAESTSSKTIGLLETNLSANQHGWVITEGVLSGIDTSAATAGQSVWLSGTEGGRVYGSPPAEPAHSVYLGVVTKANASTGEIFVKVQNGYELNELHDVSTGSAASGDVIQYDGSMWNSKSLSAAGISATSHNHSGTYANLSHSHAESDVTGLVTDLAGKAASVHTHSQSDVTSLSTALAGKSDTTHDHSGTYDPAGTASSAVSTHDSTTTSVHGISNTANLVYTSDSRLSDARTPTAHKTSHSTGGTDALSASDIGAAASSHTHSYASTTHASTHAAAGSDPLSGISPSQITGTAVITTDSRLSDSRTPTAHASTHNAGGTDALAIDAVAATGSLRTLGTSATSAAAGNHAHSGTYVTPGGTVTLTGNVTGSATMSSSGTVSISTTIASIPSNTVTLGTDTTGNYVASLVAGTGVTLTNNTGEGATPTVAIGQAVATTSNVTFNNITANGTTTLNGTAYLGNASSDIVYSTSMYGTSTITNSQDVRIFFGATSGTNYQWRIFRDTSSRRYKRNITHIEDTDKILDVQPVTYYDKVDYDNNDGDVELQYGLIAEEMAENEVGTNYVVRGEDGSIESVQYSRLVVPLLSALRHLRKRVDELEAKVNESSS